MEVKAKPDINSLIKSAIREASNNNWEKAKKLNLVILNISKNNICPPYPDCIMEIIGEQDTSSCP